MQRLSVATSAQPALSQAGQRGEALIQGAPDPLHGQRPLEHGPPPPKWSRWRVAATMLHHSWIFGSQIVQPIVKRRGYPIGGAGRPGDRCGDKVAKRGP